MTDFLIYDAKVAVLITVFYMFYRLMLSRETFHRVNRVVLLLTAVASFVLPLCVITMHKTVTLEATPMVTVGDIQVETVAEAPSAPWQLLLSVLFIIGMVLTLFHTLSSVLKVWLLIRKSERHPLPDGTILCVTGNAEVSPFSWMHYIVMNRSDYEEHNAAILAHERGHIRLRHSWDLLLVDLLTALQWFNPAMWMLRQDLRAIHEYEADGAVLSQGINARQYQYLLITKAVSIGGYSIANGISHSTLKNRITMMLHKKSQRTSLLKLLALLPIVGTALALNAETITDYRYEEPQKKIIKKGKKNTTVKTDTVNELVVVAPPAQPQQVEPVEMPNPLKVDQKMDRAFDVVEEMPQFPGGSSALLEYLAANIRYPKAAYKAGVQGRVILTFVVEKDGSISGTEVVKSVSPLLDAEAVRVINAMPNWVPGRQNGKVVRVKYTVPVSFMLQDDSPKKMTEGGTFNTNEYDIEVDGKLVDIETLKTITPANIESMDVQKPKDGQGKGRIIVKMKQKKE